MVNPVYRSMSEYQKECIFCKEKILMSKQTGKWLPYNLNNGPHECQQKNGNGNLTNGHNEISLELVIKKLASTGITIDLEKLRNI
jgi:hypothetical protein